LLHSGGSRLVQSRRLREAFVVAQVGLALVLLVCAGLVGRSFRNLLKIDIGFKPDHVLTLNVTVPNAPRSSCPRGVLHASIPPLRSGESRVAAR